MKNIVFGLFGVSDTSVSNLRILRELTISASRYGYQGEIIEAESLNELLHKVSTLKYELCFIQKAGHIIDEQWYPPCWNRDSFYDSLKKYSEDSNFLVVGELDNNSLHLNALKDDCLLINIEKYNALNQPAFEIFKTVCKKNNLPINSFTEVINKGRYDLVSNKSFSFENQLREDPKEMVNISKMTNSQTTFLKGIRSQVDNAKKGVFLFNIESYKDLGTSPQHLDAVFSVAAGFKANRILEVNGFDEDTQVVYYDYSKRALEIRQQIVTHWDGEDFPKFIRHIFKTNPTPDTFYQLWSGVTPENINWDDVNWFWEYELEKWGGAAAFKKHWMRYQALPHTYIHYNLLADTEKLFNEIKKYNSPFIWWSNAFFTVFSNWFYSYNERKNIYEKWIDELASSNPVCRINGSDYNNTSVNGLTAQAYLERYKDNPAYELLPTKLNEIEILY